MVKSVRNIYLQCNVLLQTNPWLFHLMNRLSPNQTNHQDPLSVVVILPVELAAWVPQCPEIISLNHARIWNFTSEVARFSEFFGLDSISGFDIEGTPPGTSWSIASSGFSSSLILSRYVLTYIPNEL